LSRFFSGNRGGMLRDPVPVSGEGVQEELVIRRRSIGGERE
jgi:hypothetical protein